MPNKCPANNFFHFNWLTFLIFNTVIWHFNNNVNVQISPLWEKLKDFVTIDYAPYGKAEVLVCKINHIVFLQKYLSQTISLKTHPISETVECFSSDFERWRQGYFHMPAWPMGMPGFEIIIAFLKNMFWAGLDVKKSTHYNKIFFSQEKISSRETCGISVLRNMSAPRIWGPMNYMRKREILKI